MVETWWSLLGAVIPALIGGQALRMKKKHAEDQRINSARGREMSSDDIFVCERVCTSKRMLKKFGAFSKDPIPDTCVTVCGVSELDACSDACARAVCDNQHQVPNWNDICLRRCQNLNIQPHSKQGNTNLEGEEDIADDGDKDDLIVVISKQSTFTIILDLIRSNMSGMKEENAADLKLGQEFLKAKCLMNCEVALILDHRYMSQTTPINQVFEKSVQ